MQQLIALYVYFSLVIYSTSQIKNPKQKIKKEKA